MKSVLIVFLFLVGCGQDTRRHRSNLVIAVEGLDFNSANCLGQPKVLFSDMCREAIRFTNAYSTSTQSQAALASILTAMYPVEHGVRHNGNHFLNEKIETVSEVAISKGIRTSFFSGGPPIWAKSGLGQGFEVFEDNIKLSLGRYYRPAGENLEFFKRWLGRISGSDSFLSVIFLPDLQFRDYPTVDEKGVERSLTRESQLLNLDLELNQFFTFLKRERRWDDTNVFLLGLNGAITGTRPSEVRGTNLHVENTHVTLMIKPARPFDSREKSWSIGSNVSLVDVGASLFSILGARDFSFFDRSYEIVSLTTSVERPVVNWDRDRMILVESFWPMWQFVSGPRFSLRSGPWLYIHDTEEKVYNSLKDSQELLLRTQSERTPHRFKEFLLDKNLAFWTPPPNEFFQQLRLELDLSELVALELDPKVIGRNFDWYVYNLVKRKLWDRLHLVAKDRLGESWNYVVERLLSIESQRESFCGGALVSDGVLTESLPDECRSALLVSFLRWAKASSSGGGTSLGHVFFKEYLEYLVDRDLLVRNVRNGHFWSLSASIKPRPDLVELLLLLPEYKRHKDAVDRYISSISRGP